MSNGIPTDPPATRTFDWTALVRRAWGDEWLKRDIVYEMQNGRRFEDSGAASGIYSGTGA